MSFIRKLDEVKAKGVNGERVYEMIAERDDLPFGAAIVLARESKSHHHDYTHELYIVTSENPNAVIHLNDKIYPLKRDDVVYIAPGTRHKVKANGQEPIKIDVITIPPWSEKDHHLDG